MCDYIGRLLRGVGGVCCDWLNLVGVVRAENEEAAGSEPLCMEVQSYSVRTLSSSVPQTLFVAPPECWT